MEQDNTSEPRITITLSKGIPMTFNYAVFWYTGHLPVAAGGGAFVYRYETIEEAQNALCRLHTLDPAIAYTLVKVIGDQPSTAGRA